MRLKGALIQGMGLCTSAARRLLLVSLLLWLAIAASRC